MNELIKIASYNVRGVKNDKKRREIFEYLHAKKYDIVCLQETHYDETDKKKWEKEWKGKIFHSIGSNRSKGCAILVKETMTTATLQVQQNLENGRLIKMEFTSEDGRKYYILCIYAPNDGDERRSFFKRLNRKIEQETNDETCIIIGGDFNCTLNILEDRTNKQKYPDVGHKELHEVIKKHSLEDVWRRRNPQKREYTWDGGENRKIKSRIDYWLISQKIDPNVIECKNIEAPFSDHCLVEIVIQNSEAERGPGIWIMNVEVLKSPIFDKCFKELWRHAINNKTKYTDAKIWWDSTKNEIKDLAMWVSSQTNRQMKENITTIETELARIKDKPGEERNITNLKLELKELYEDKHRGEKIRSRAKWWDEGEKSTNYFFSLEKIKQQNKNWTAILDKSGNTVEGIENIQQIQKEFYEDLYKSQNLTHNESTINEFLEFMDQRLSEEEREELERDITLEEMEKVVKLMPNNKSPGLDGIPIEFYKQYWELIGDEVHKIISEALDGGELTTSQRRTAVILLYKKGERKDIKNWRPLKKINTDRKIGSKIMTERLKKVLHKIIHEDQTGGIKGRYIGENVRLLLDIIEMKEQENEDGVILLMDEEKAYDRVERPWVYTVMRHVNIGNRFIKWVKTIYNKGEACIITNGYKSSFFRETRGLLQGESLSGFLYILQAEPLSRKIKADNNITGMSIKKPNIQCKIAAFMDDTSIPLRKLTFIPTVLNTIHKFEEITGSKLNISKTKGIVLKRENTGTHFGIECIYSSEKVLGIHIGNEIDLNGIWNDLCKKTEKKLDQWQKRDLSITGKILLIKTLAISKIIYNMNMQCFTDAQLEQFNKIMYNFLWNGKQHFIAKSICEENRTVGGLSMPNTFTIKTCTRIQWVLRSLQNYRQNNNRISAVIPLNYFECLDQEFSVKLYALRVDSCADRIKKLNMPKFYQECILSFQELLRKTKNIRSRDNEIIWDNSEITINNNTLRNKKWAKKGILTRRDISIDNEINELLIRSFNVNDAHFMFDLAKVKKAIPSEWLKLKSRNRNINPWHDTNQAIDMILNQPIQFSKDKVRTIGKLNANEIKQLLNMRDVDQLEAKKEYWNKKIGLDKKDWQKFIYQTCLNKSTPRKINDFNLKIIHGMLNTEIRLCKMKLSPSNLCSICKKEPEDMKHLFINCNGLEHIWSWITNTINSHLLDQETENQYEITDTEKITNYKSPEITKLQELVTGIIAITRHNIWKRRCKQRYDNKLDTIETTIKLIKQELKQHVNNVTYGLQKNTTILKPKLEKIQRYLNHKPP